MKSYKRVKFQLTEHGYNNKCTGVFLKIGAHSEIIVSKALQAYALKTIEEFLFSEEFFI